MHNLALGSPHAGLARLLDEPRIFALLRKITDCKIAKMMNWITTTATSLLQIKA